MSLYPFNDSMIHLLSCRHFAEYQGPAIVNVSSKGSLLISSELKITFLKYLCPKYLFLLYSSSSFLHCSCSHAGFFSHIGSLLLAYDARQIIEAISYCLDKFKAEVLPTTVDRSVEQFHIVLTSLKQKSRSIPQQH